MDMVHNENINNKRQSDSQVAAGVRRSTPMAKARITDRTDCLFRKKTVNHGTITTQPKRQHVTHLLSTQ